MVASMSSEFLAGGAFGAALIASGVYQPSMIIGQMKLESFQMLQVMLSASASSALVFSIAQWSQVAPKNPRPASRLGFFPYDGNVVGGAISGTGMAFGGACPGTALVQTALGLPSGPQVIFGGLLGAVAFLTLKSWVPDSLRNGQPPPTTKDERSTAIGNESATSPATIPLSLGISESIVLIVWEILCLVGLVLLQRLPSGSNFSSFLEPLGSGMLIGAAQVATIGLARHSIGVSTAYEDVARWLWPGLGTGKVMARGIKRLVTPSTAFAAGIVSASVLTLCYGALSLGTLVAGVPSVSPPRPVLSGALLIFGARVAGGCTSGHSISGLAAFSMSSLITTAAMFGSGVLTAKLIG